MQADPPDGNRGLCFRGVLLLATALALGALLFISGAGARTTASAPPSALRILYASDWTGTTEIFAADATGRSLGQLTFGRPESTCHSPAACGYIRPQPSPDGRRLVYWSTGSFPGEPSTLWLANADGTRARRIGDGFVAAWRPDSRRLAYSAEDGIHLLTVEGTNRIVVKSPARELGWSPDGRTLAFTTGEIPAPTALYLYRDGSISLLLKSGGKGDGFLAFAWSPDSRVIAYSTRSGVFVASVGGPRLSVRRVYRHAIATFYHCMSGVDSSLSELAFSPNGRLLAFTLDGAPGVLDTHGWRARTFRDSGHDLTWAPDGRSLLFLQGCSDTSNDHLAAGDIQSISLTGHVRTLISSSHPYGGQIVSAAWTTPQSSVRYRRAQPVTGVFAGGPVQKLAADGGRVAYASCGWITAWTVETAVSARVEGGTRTGCYSAFTRAAHVGSLAIADDRVLWWWADLGLGFNWSMREARIGGEPADLAHGSGSLGGTPSDGTGTAVGSGSLLVMSSWTLRYANGNRAVAQQQVERVDPGGCPCPAVSGTPGPYTPLDVEQNRIVVSGTNETRVLAGDGAVRLSVPLPTLAAQLSGSQLAIAAGKQLQLYNVDTGNLTASWPMPGSPVGHDCDLYADPSCDFGSPQTQVTLEDVAHGLAVYVYAGQVHLLRLSDGADRVIAYGTLARFTNIGLVYADGARIWSTSYDRLPLHESS